ncbi:hypothetical protein DAPPUDRAFT_307976 [Daphnia pulex]|uniref:Uncharacterized protein n=1 Tax=Daphnia pulex TaxID=6669 RepID=E9I5V2_DAPPU|nr:hypothetical protein DAPPUDRAFT_307976 [Daphnia pulex]|eukprot:EFX60629.1 hypothetical protein DAPPUDRAFT_307976 [Daphnia pulex]
MMVLTNAQYFDSLEVETRDNPTAYLREKRQIAVVPQFVTTNLVQPNILDPASGCFWSGTAPFCIPACGKSYQEMLTDKRGDGKRCWTGYKKRCCPLPAGVSKVLG